MDDRVGGGCAGGGCADGSNTYDTGGRRVLRVIEELDDILTALRVLTRTCEKRKLHMSTHALELASEIVLRRRNYILNACSMAGIGPTYDSFPCENCYITYPTAFIISWLEYMSKYNGTPDGQTCWSLLCKRTCSLYFDTPPTVDRLVDDVLYPMGAPYSAGPKGGPPELLLSCGSRVFGEHYGRPTSSSLYPRLVGECEETDCLYRTVDVVSRLMRFDNEDDTRSDSILAGCLANLLYTRRNLGFDMDCIDNSEIDESRLRLSEALHSFGSEFLDETFAARFPFKITRSLPRPEAVDLRGRATD